MWMCERFYIKNRKIQNWCFYRRRNSLTRNLTWAEKHNSAKSFKMPSTPRIKSLPQSSSHFNAASKNNPPKVKIWKTWSIHKLPVTPPRKSWGSWWIAGSAWASSVPGQHWKPIAPGLCLQVHGQLTEENSYSSTLSPRHNTSGGCSPVWDPKGDAGECAQVQQMLHPTLPGPGALALCREAQRVGHVPAGEEAASRASEQRPVPAGTMAGRRRQAVPRCACHEVERQWP